MSRCPDLTRIAAYLDDQLVEEERRAIEEHLASCEECSSVFAESVACLAELRAGEAVEAPTGGRAFLGALGSTSQGRGIALAAVLAVTATGAGWWHFAAGGGPRGAGSSATSAVGVDAAVDHRPVLARLTGVGWAARPPEPLRGAGVEPPELRGSWVYSKMLDDAQVAAGDSPDAGQLQKLGAAYVLAGRVDSGLTALGRAAAAPADPRALSDLAAAYLARGLARGDGNDLAEALEVVGRALDAAPRLAEARFNRALVLEALPLPGEAARAWKAYLEVDATSPWAAEAKTQLQGLAARGERERPADAGQLRVEIVAAAAAGDSARLVTLVTAHRQEAREAFMLDLLPAWGMAAADGDDVEAALRLEAARRLASEWREETDDSSLLHQVEEIEHAAGATKRFARGRQALAIGLEALEEMKVVEAAGALAAAQRELPDASAARLWADLSALACDYYRRGPETGALRRLEELARRASGDQPLSAHVAWLRGLLHFRRGEPQTLALYEQALAEFERLGEADHENWLHHLLGDAHALFGDLPRAWSHRRQMLAAMPTLTHRQRRFPLLLGPAIGSAYLEDRPRVASALLGELSPNGASWVPRQAAELELWRSRIELKLGHPEQARLALSTAKAWLWQVEDPAVRHRLASDLQAGSGFAAESSRSAIASLSPSIDRARGATPDFRFPGLLLERARSYRQLGEARKAGADLREGIAWLLRQPPADPVQSLFSERLSSTDALFQELVALELTAGAQDRAFAVTEQGRSRALVQATLRGQQTERLPSAEDRPSTLSGLREELEPGTTLLYFCLLAKEALLWRVDSSGAAMIRLEARPPDLATWADRLQTDLAAGAWTERTREAARRLYRELILPARLGKEVRKLVVVPDGALDQVPFAALVDPRTNRYLIEQQSVEVAPSAGAFRAARARARQLGPGRPSILALGDPTADRELFPDLQALPAAGDEARRVARWYPRRELLLGERATRDALLARAGSFDVVHFAGHAVVSTVDPTRSSLALARTPGSARPGALFAYELSPARFERTRVVVLAGCGTGSGPQSAGAGTLSLARAFLAAQVPTVVATLWPIADGRTTELMVSLHAGLSRGDDAATALRDAQLAQLRSPESRLSSPATWAAFFALGG